MTTQFKKFAAGFALAGFLFTGALAGVGYSQARATTTNGVVTIRQIISGSLSFASGTTVVINENALGTTSTDAIVLQNTTAATAGVPVQISPRARFRGTAWDTAASETVDFFFENLPANAATPTGTFRLGYSLNGAAVSYPLTVTNAGVLTLGNSLQITSTAVVPPAAGLMYWTNRALLRSPADAQFNIENAAQTSGIGLDVSADSQVDIRTRAQSGYGSVRALLFKITSGGSTTISTGVGSVKMSTANAATNTAWIPFDYAGTTYYVPAWTTNAP